MAAPCTLYLKLEGRVTDLTAKFMADQLAAEIANPTSFTPDLDCLAAFRLLVHAEVEEFLEEKAKENLHKIGLACKAAGYDLWSKSEFFALALILGYRLDITTPFSRSDFLSQIAALLKTAGEWIGNNNGIKASSFYQLSIFAGKTAEELDSSLAATLTSYGKNRGDVAHKSITRVANLQAPSTEKKAAIDILVGLRTFFYGP